MIKHTDTFGKNIAFVFLGTSIYNLFNLLFQLLIAHRLSPMDFAAFNALLGIIMLISSPLGTLSSAVAKYSAEFNAQNQIKKIQVLLTSFLKITSIFAFFSFFIFHFISVYVVDKLKIPSISSGYITAILLSLSWITPVFLGGMQGLELFKWFVFIMVVCGALKLILVFLFIKLGFNIAGALAPLLITNFLTIILSFCYLKPFISLNILKENLNYQINSSEEIPLTTATAINFKEVFSYLFPVAISAFSFITLVNIDMILVRYFFSLEDSGLYAVAQMVGKVFLFLPSAISVVMFPRVSGLNAKNEDTTSVLKRALLYAVGLCVLANLVYNIFPVFILKILTGKVFPESVMLGRLFSISMSFFTLIFILTTYFLSIKDLRFIKYFVLFTVIQFLAIILFHKNLVQVQFILCINAILLFSIHLILAYKKGTVPAIAN